MQKDHRHEGDATKHPGGALVFCGGLLCGGGGGVL